jgi:DNA-binding HxlR family transcriptional regulator
VASLAVPGPGFEHVDAEKCRSFQDSVELVGRRWTAGVLLAGMRGARRFVEYRALVAGISDRLLTQRLKELEDDGLIERTVVPTTPVLVRYVPTERARGLMQALHPLIAWSASERESED